MYAHMPATPFGRRPASLGQIASQLAMRRAVEQAEEQGSNAPAAVNKWQLFRTLTEIRESLGISDRTLGLLNALLTFHPETALTLPRAEGVGEDPAGAGCDLIVFPSNRQLSLRAHGMAEKTLRNHLSALVGAGLIIRRDSPNGKRYARKAVGGADRFSEAFGFDLTPLVARAAEFEAVAEQRRVERRRLQIAKERISLHRRDIAKLIALALEESAPGPWEDLRLRYLGLLTPLRQVGSLPAAIELEARLSALRGDVAKALELFVSASKNTGNDGIFDRHQSNSKSQSPSDSEPATKRQDATIEDAIIGKTEIQDGSLGRAAETKALPLGLVLEACPDVADYARNGDITSWSDFRQAVGLIRPMIGISPDAWREAQDVLGADPAHVAVAAILQRSIHSTEAAGRADVQTGSMAFVVNGSPAIQSPGGYLRALTDKARKGDFGLGPMLMALIGQRLKARRGAGSTAGLSG
jgi:replication initiation protein RepC